MRIELLADHRHLITKIAAFLHGEWGAFPPWASLPTIEARLAAGSQSHGVPFTLVALSAENDFLGTASVKLFELPAHHDKEHWLSEVFIPKSLRGQGIGSALIADCIKRSFDLGVPTLYLYTPDQQRLYEKFGWHEAVQTVVNDEAVSIMERHATHNPFKRDAGARPLRLSSHPKVYQ
jgi:GNAT superfamily N-acetyltransferase